MHYSFWQNGQENSSIILNCEWFSAKSPHCQCPKITFKLLFSWLLHDGSSHQHSIIETKINMMPCHNLATSAQVISPVLPFCYFFIYIYIFHVTLSVWNRRKCKFMVILTLQAPTPPNGPTLAKFLSISLSTKICTHKIFRNLPFAKKSTRAIRFFHSWK